MTERFERLAQRSDRAGHQHVVAGGLPRNPRPFVIDLPELSVETVRPEFEPVGPVGVGLDELRSGLDVFVVNLPDEGGGGEVEFVEAAVDEHPAVVQHGPHRAVAEHDPLGHKVQYRRTFGEGSGVGTHRAVR